MTLNEIKMKRVLAALSDQDDSISEAKDKKSKKTKKPSRTPLFIKHCVAAIVQKPATLARVQAGGQEAGGGSPFAVCSATYNKDKRKLAADHSQQAKGEKKHHTLKDYEQALEKLREDNRREKLDRSRVVFEQRDARELRRSDRRRITFVPRD